MKLRHLFISSVIALSLTSCITDNSTEASSDTSLLSLEHPIENIITLNRWDTLTLAPKVLQTNQQKKVFYQWEVNYKVVSTAPILKYECKEAKTLPCRLKITNGDDIRFYTFSVHVQPAYVKGLYILAENGGKTIVSYLPDAESHKKFTFDALSKNNPQLDFSGEPVAIAQAKYAKITSPLLYVAIGNQSKIYEIYQDSMTVGFTYQPQGKVSFMQYNSAVSTPNMIVWLNNKLKTMSMVDVNHKFYDYSDKWKTGLKHPMQFANERVGWYTPNHRYVHGYAYFDNANGAIITQSVSNSKIPLTLLPNTFLGDSLIGMGSLDKELKLALITLNKGSRQIYFYYVYPGYYTSKTETTSPAKVIEKHAMPMSSHVGSLSVVRTTSNKSLVFYSNKNAVYAYNVLSNGNFPTTPWCSVGSASDQIVDMYVNDEGSLIYIAANSKDAKMPGSIYCWDINNHKLLWQKQHITGKIKAMVYRK